MLSHFCAHRFHQKEQGLPFSSVKSPTVNIKHGTDWFIKHANPLILTMSNPLLNSLPHISPMPCCALPVSFTCATIWLPSIHQVSTHWIGVKATVLAVHPAAVQRTFSGLNALCFTTWHFISSSIGSNRAVSCSFIFCIRLKFVQWLIAYWEQWI